MSNNAPLVISQTKPDFESILMQLQLYVQSKGTWNNVLPQGTGETILEAAAAVGAFNQMGIDTAFREAFFTARRASSIYSITHLLGVRISRKLPGSVPVKLTRSNIGVSFVPAFTQFLINGTKFFNRSNIVFGEVESVRTILYEGVIKTENYNGDETPFRELQLSVPGFRISDQDIDVVVIDASTGEEEKWSRQTDGIWLANSDEQIYQDFTDGDGNCILRFGNGKYGATTGTGRSIGVRFAVTAGSLGDGGSAGALVTCPDYEITGVSEGPVTGGADEKEPEFYSVVAPFMFRAKGRCASRSDFKATVLSYPGVASAVIQTQKDIAPSDKRWMNTIRICVLPKSTDKFNVNQWESFIKYISSKTLFDIVACDPTRISTSISMRVAVKSTANPNVVKDEIRYNLLRLFEKNKNTLGRRIAITDITKCATDVEGVDYVDMVTPQDDLLPISPLAWFFPDSINIVTFATERKFTNGGI